MHVVCAPLCILPGLFICHSTGRSQLKEKTIQCINEAMALSTRLSLVTRPTPHPYTGFFLSLASTRRRGIEEITSELFACTILAYMQRIFTLCLMLVVHQ